MFEFVKKIFSPFSKMGSKLGLKIQALFSKPVDESTFVHLEQILYEADLGPAIAMDLVARLRTFLKQNSIEDAVGFLKMELRKYFPKCQASIPFGKPHVILVVGTNGSGKTTTIAKLSSRYKKEGKKVLLGAADTFRAAALEQLQNWANRLEVDLIKSAHGSDPSSVAFDTIHAAITRGIDIVIIDTAGRLQSKENLMLELNKINRVIKKQLPEAPHETFLVLDASIGQNALDQARTFHQFCPITGCILTKLDGTAKGGIAIALQKELQIPIRYVGLGEQEDDLIPFDVDRYLDALLQ